MNNDCKQLGKEEVEVRSSCEYTLTATFYSTTLIENLRVLNAQGTGRQCAYLGAVTDFFPCSKMRCILLVLVSSAA